MDLRRREIVAAGAAAVGALPLFERDQPGSTDGSESDTVGEKEVATLLALAETVYPSSVEYDEEFLTSHVESRSAARQAGIRIAIDDLNRFARKWYGRSYPRLDSGARQSLLAQVGVGCVWPDPNGSASERIMYYLVNQLLYALYTDPRGSRLFGIDNPVGYPGGYQSYQEPPRR
jgi:hypothetical protein